MSAWARRVDAFLLGWFDALVLWAWEVLGVSKATLMRALMFCGQGAYFLDTWSIHLASTIFAIAFCVAMQILIEAFLGYYTEIYRAMPIIRWVFVLMCFLPSYAFLAILNGVCGSLWAWIAGAKIPRTRRRSRRKERSSVLAIRGASL